uniref:Uncharacterized protein n=1 Tax=Arundo donax TaxID=35708 RepID=A0A0A9FT94_ARUDO
MCINHFFSVGVWVKA